MKKAFLFIILCLAFLFCLSSCWYSPPEGWTKKHHSYEEVSEYAESIDPCAAVTEGHADTVDEYGQEFREWDAVINGVDCHVASVADWVWNSGLAAGEFASVYYRIDTDLDSVIMQNILSEEYPAWRSRTDIGSRYNRYKTVYVELAQPEYRMLEDEELEEIWREAYSINERFSALSVVRKAVFCVPSPGVYWDSQGEDRFVKKDSHAYIEEFSETGKAAFLQEYHENWALLESDMPIRDGIG